MPMLFLIILTPVSYCVRAALWLWIAVNCSSVCVCVWVCIGAKFPLSHNNHNISIKLQVFSRWQWQTATLLIFIRVFFFYDGKLIQWWESSLMLCKSVLLVHYNGNCCVTFTACQGSAAPAWSKLTRQSKDVLGNNLKHYLWGWQLPLQWTMTSPKLSPLSIYLQQCGTSHIKAVRLVFPVPATACS